MRAVALVGPTAAGKSALAVDVALRAGDVEIVSIDSMAIYRGMNIGTATPSPDEQAAVPHHLIDLLDPWQDCTLSFFQTAATEAIGAISGRGRIALLVGGSGLYHRAVIDHLEIPGQYPLVRSALEAELVEPAGPSLLMGRLEQLDPLAASRIEPGNVRRIIRALEVCEGSGRPFSSYGPGLDAYPDSDVIEVGFLPPLETVYEAVERRVAAWIDEGLLVEVARLQSSTKAMSRTAAQAIGYHEMLEHLDGRLSLDAAVAETVRRTRNLVRRQVAWFRRDPRVLWCSTAAEATEILTTSLARVRGSVEVRD